jgi:hypothetical protein
MTLTSAPVALRIAVSKLDGGEVFIELWTQGLVEYDSLKGMDWEWLATDGAMYVRAS